MRLFNILATLSFIYMYIRQVTQLGDVPGVAARAAADKTKNLLGYIYWKTSMIPGLESWQSIQTACPLQVNILKDSVRHKAHAGLREVFSVCSVNISRLSFVSVYKCRDY